MLAATQRPIAFSAGSAPSGVPAWKTIPSWSLIGTADHVIPPAELLFMSRRAHAHITEINAGHLSLISHPGRGDPRHHRRGPGRQLTSALRQRTGSRGAASAAGGRREARIRRAGGAPCIVRHVSIDSGQPYAAFRAAYETAVPASDRLEAVGVVRSGAGWSGIHRAVRREGRQRPGQRVHLRSQPADEAERQHPGAGKGATCHLAAVIVAGVAWRLRPLALGLALGIHYLYESYPG